MGSLTPLKSDDYFWTNSDSVRCLGVKRFISELLLNSISDYCNIFSIYVRGILQYTFFYKQPIFGSRPANCLGFYKKSPPKIV